MRIVPVEKEDLPMVKALLAEVNLPLEGVEENFFNFLKLVMDGELAAVAGLEVYGKCGLLRSVAVAPAYQHSGLGRGITRAMINRARELGLTEIYLLTRQLLTFLRASVSNPLIGAPWIPRCGSRRNLRVPARLAPFACG